MSSSLRHNKRAETTVSILLLAMIYYAAGKFGLSLAFLNASASAVWHPSGIALAALLLWGRRLWPGVFIGAFLVNLTTQGSIGVALGIATGNTLEALVSVILMERFANGQRAFERARDIFLFILLCAILSTMLSATIGVSSLCLGGLAGWEQCGNVWLTWWLGDMTGQLILAPLIIIWVREGFLRRTWKEVAEAAALLVSVWVTGQIVFYEKTPFDYLVMIPLLWATFRFGQLGAITAAMITSGIALWRTLNQVGPFAVPDLNKSLLLLQTFMSVITVTTLVLAAVISERERVEQSLRKAREQLAQVNEDLERRVQERTGELKETNSSLEAFAYSIAHDLRAPLRSMRSFSNLLLENHAPNLDETGRDYVRRIAGSAESMDRLVLDLLAYSNVARSELALTQVSVESAWTSALAQNDETIREKKAEVQVTLPLPMVRAQLPMLDQVLANLLSNALKFVQRDVTPQIQFWAEERAEVVRLCIKDNGIGIAPEHQERVFSIFEQLNGKAYEGTGIGLSIVRKGVERMGGQVGLESEPGAGSRFWIELPRAWSV